LGFRVLGYVLGRWAVFEDVLVRVTAKGIGTGVVVAALSLGLAACGVRGSLDAPAAAKVDGTAKSAEAAGTLPGSAAPPKPHEGFILDPLLR
jgi:predicted small lipoprotein YifL